MLNATLAVPRSTSSEGVTLKLNLNEISGQNCLTKGWIVRVVSTHDAYDALNLNNLSLNWFFVTLDGDFSSSSSESGNKILLGYRRHQAR